MPGTRPRTHPAFVNDLTPVYGQYLTLLDADLEWREQPPERVRNRRATSNENARGDSRSVLDDRMHEVPRATRRCVNECQAPMRTIGSMWEPTDTSMTLHDPRIRMDLDPQQLAEWRDLIARAVAS